MGLYTPLKWFVTVSGEKEEGDRAAEGEPFANSDGSERTRIDFKSVVGFRLIFYDVHIKYFCSCFESLHVGLIEFINLIWIHIKSFFYHANNSNSMR